MKICNFNLIFVFAAFSRSSSPAATPAGATIGFDWQLPVPVASIPSLPVSEPGISVPILQIPSAVLDQEKAENRSNDLKMMQSLYQTEPWEFTITQNNNKPTLTMFGPRSVKFHKDFHGKADRISRQLLNESAAVLIRGSQVVERSVFAITDAVQKMPIETLEDLTNLFTSFSSKVPPPNSLKDWQRDEAFGEHRLTWGGYSLKKENQDVLQVAADVAKLVTGGETVADLLNQGRLFAVDFTGMGKYTKNAQNISNPLQQSVPSTYGQFFLAKDGSFMPLAIKVVEANNLVFTPQDSPQDWMFAKLAFSASEAVFLPVEHFNVCHWNLLGMRTEAFRHLHHTHPVSALIQHHYQDSYGIVADGIKGLLQAGVDLDRTFGSGGKGAAFAVVDRDKTFDFTKQKFRNFFKIAGTDSLPGYKYRDDLLAIHGAIANFSIEYLSSYYKSDADVQADAELQAWAAATAHPEFGGMNGFPTQFNDLASLADTLADLITFVTGQHNILNGFGTWDGQSFPAHPSAIYGPFPSSKGQITDARSYIASTPELISLELGLHVQFRRPSLDSQILGYSYEQHLGSLAASAIRNFQANLAGISRMIKEREVGNPRPFLSGSPDQIIYQAWI